jgi:hypothetical protein
MAEHRKLDRRRAYLRRVGLRKRGCIVIGWPSGGDGKRCVVRADEMLDWGSSRLRQGSLLQETGFDTSSLMRSLLDLLLRPL